jgi:membrane protein DedA with SNARE-associated domain
MQITSLIIHFIARGKYPIIFLLLFLEGSATNFFSSGLAATGALNIWVIWIAAILLELTADVVYYTIGGRMSDSQILARIDNTDRNEFIKTLNETYKSHPGLTLMVAKFLGPFSIPGIMYLGKHKALPLPKFIETSAVVAISRGTLISFAGYMVGKGLTVFTKVYSAFEAIGVVVIIAVIFFLVMNLILLSL